MNLRVIDAYITDSRYYKQEETFACRVCGNELTLMVEVEYGRYVLPDEARCCGWPMEEV